MTKSATLRRLLALSRPEWKLLGWGIVCLAIGSAMSLLYPQGIRIIVDGALPYGTLSKDLVIWIISRIGAQGARGYAVEYAGSTIGALSTEARMTLCNMTLEAGARGALIAPDTTTLNYVRAHANLDAGQWDAALRDWAELRSDDDAVFDADTSFPVLEPASWRELSRQHRPADPANSFALDFVVYERRPLNATGS